MSRPWMPFYPNDFRLDTLDLSAEEIGVYMVMICLAWRRGDGGLPDDMDWLKRTLKQCFRNLHGHTFNRIVPGLLKRYFELKDGIWYQKRVVKELQKADKISAKQAQNADKRWAKEKENKDLSDASAMPSQSQPQSHKERERDARARDESLFSRASAEITDAILAAGKREADDPCATGLLYAAQTWLNEGIPQDLILAFAAPVAHKPVSYISKTVRSQWIEHKAQPPPVASIATSQRNRGNGNGTTQSASAAGRRLLESGVSFGPRPGTVRPQTGDDDVRLLPQGRSERS